MLLKQIDGHDLHANGIPGAQIVSHLSRATLSPLMARFADEPVLIDPDRIELVRANLHVLDRHARAAEMLDERAGNDDFWPTDQNDWRSSVRPYNVSNGILQIPVMGVLLNRFGYQFGAYATGYTYIEKALERGLADANVRGIAFIHDSPGGVVAGNFELNDKIHAARGEKPMRAFVADHSYSASYSLASAAGNIIVTRSGGVGSIGVVTTHVEYSKMLQEVGVAVTFIFAGKHKVDGNAYEKLSADSKARMQERIDKIYSVFTAAVSRNRGMDEKAIRRTEALTYDAQDAIEVGLADKVGALLDEMAIFSSELDIGDEHMATTVDAGIPQAQHDQAVAAARVEGKAEGLSEGMKAQKDRINAILASDAGKKRPKAAMSAALTTSMTADEAAAFLVGIAEEKAEEAQPAGKGRNHFDEAMGGNTPKVNAGDGGDGDGGKPTHAQSILADYQQGGGRVRKSA